MILNSYYSLKHRLLFSKRDTHTYNDLMNVFAIKSVQMLTNEYDFPPQPCAILC